MQCYFTFEFYFWTLFNCIYLCYC